MTTYTTTDDLRRDVEEMLGSEGSRDLALRVTAYLRENGLAPYEGNGFAVDWERIDLLQIAEKVLA